MNNEAFRNKKEIVIDKDAVKGIFLILVLSSHVVCELLWGTFGIRTEVMHFFKDLSMAVFVFTGMISLVLDAAKAKDWL